MRLLELTGINIIQIMHLPCGNVLIEYFIRVL